MFFLEYALASLDPVNERRQLLFTCCNIAGNDWIVCCFSGTKSEMTEFNQGIFTPRLQSSSLTLSTRPSPSIFLFIIGASPSVREVSYAQMHSSNANMVAFVRRTRSRSPSTRAFPKRGRSPASAPCPLQHNAPSQSGLPHRTCAPSFLQSRRVYY